jgi:cysteine synthase
MRRIPRLPGHDRTKVMSWNDIATTGSDRHNSPSNAIGGTPLIRLRQASATTGCEILAKAEFMNPGGSVKDRAALAIIDNAEQRNLIEPGGIIVEGTAGNMGIGLALVANARGYRTIIVMPDTQSEEKRQMLRALGVQQYVVPEAHHEDPNNYRRVAERMARALASETEGGVVWANQFDNLANRQGHFATTGREIWEQTHHEVDAFICSVGTGGTLAGVSRFLKQANPDVTIGIADPEGAAMYSYYTSGKLSYEGGSITEGIGLRWMTGNLEGTQVDYAVQIPDAETLKTIYSVASDDGLFVGGSSGVNVAGAIHLARKLGPGHTVVTILCDSGARYQSKLFDAAFLGSRGLPPPPWRDSGASHPVEQFLER